MPSIEERRKVAKLLRGMVGDTAGLSDGEFIDLVEEIVCGAVMPASQDPDAEFLLAPQDPDAAFLNRLADLIDPTEHERTVADNRRIIDRNRELECELAQVKREVERQRRLSRIDRERAELVSQLEDENLELKKRLGCFEDVTPPVPRYVHMRDRCERLERELAEEARDMGGGDGR